MRGPSAETLIARALAASAAGAGTPIAIAAHSTIAWRSATFSGGRHVFEARGATTAALEDWLARVPELDLSVPGHVIADLAVARCGGDAGTTSFRVEGLSVASA